MSFAFLCPNCSFCFYYSFYVCFLVLLSILCVLCLCIVSFLLMYTVVSFLFVHKFTDDCHRVKTKLQLIHIICLHLPHDFMACKGTPLPLLTPVSLRWSLSLKCWENFDFRLSSCNEYWFLVLGILHGVQGKFPDDVLGAAVGLILNGHKLERKVTYDHWRWDPQRLPKRRQEIYLAHSAKSSKPKIRRQMCFCKVII